MLNKNKPLLLILGILLLVGGCLLVSNFATEDNAETEEVAKLETLSAFSWRFIEADTNNPDGNPQTKVYLTAIYEGGSRVEKLVDTVDGGCSELEGEKYQGDISNTGKVQCYYAGLGQQYRIVEDEDSYLAERKFFEESSPDYVPPESSWEVIADFTKMF